jgi:hypothetical protein
MIASHAVSFLLLSNIAQQSSLLTLHFISLAYCVLVFRLRVMSPTAGSVPRRTTTHSLQGLGAWALEVGYRADCGKTKGTEVSPELQVNSSPELSGKHGSAGDGPRLGQKSRRTMDLRAEVRDLERQLRYTCRICTRPLIHADSSLPGAATTQDQLQRTTGPQQRSPTLQTTKCRRPLSCGKSASIVTSLHLHDVILGTEWVRYQSSAVRHSANAKPDRYAAPLQVACALSWVVMGANRKNMLSLLGLKRLEDRRDLPG